MPPDYQDGLSVQTSPPHPRHVAPPLMVTPLHFPPGQEAHFSFPISTFLLRTAKVVASSCLISKPRLARTAPGPIRSIASSTLGALGFSAPFLPCACVKLSEEMTTAAKIRLMKKTS